MQTRSVRSHLFQVLLLSIIPVGLFAGALLFFHWKAQEKERERSQIESARLIATAVDNALDSTVQRIAILARVWGSTQASDRAIYEQSQTALAANPDWQIVVAFRSDGSAVFRTDSAFGAPAPRMSMKIFAPVLERGEVVITDVFTSPTRGAKVVSVAVPVMRDGKPTHVLIVALNLRWFDDMLRRQGQGAGGVAGVFDRQFKFVARTMEGDARRGADASPQLVADMKKQAEGIGRYESLNSVAVYTAWAPTRHGWWVAMATPTKPLEGAFWAYLAGFGFVWLLVVIGAYAFAASKARGIARSLEALESQAERLASATRLESLGRSNVKEVDRALAALERASALLHAATGERDRLLTTEREARAAAEAASRAKDEFLAMLGHELRNPLAAISYAASIVQSPHPTAEQLDFAGKAIARQTAHLKRLIDDLLDVGRVMTGKILLERSPIDLAQCARQAAGMLASAGRLAERRLEVDGDPVWIDGDPTRIEQIAGNLLANAATHTAPGGRIHLRVMRQGADAVLQVSDDGRGIPAEALPRVFDLFFQAESTHDRSSGGLGIGLTLVQRLAALHGGSVVAQSDGRGKGATFTVRIPAVAQTAEPPRTLAGQRPLAARTLLVVEDNADERESLRIALELKGQRVLLAADAGEALVLARQRPAAAIIDIGLPGMSGHDLARLLRAEYDSSLVLVALTGYGGEVEERRARDAGFDRHFTKPLDVAALLQEIEALRAAPRIASVPRVA